VSTYTKQQAEPQTISDIFDSTSPLARCLQKTPWPAGYKPTQLPSYDGQSDLKQFLLIYEATIAAFGGNTSVLAKSFVMAIRGMAHT